MPLNRTLIASAIILLTAVLLQYVNHSEDIKPNKSFSEFPTRIGEWNGKTDHFSDAVYKVLGVSDSVLTHYQTPKGQYVQLYIGYYQSQREGELIHSPKNCMPGSGWNIIDSKKVDLQSLDSNQPIKVLQLTLQNGINRQMVLYWYHSRGRVISSEYWEKLYLVWDSILRHRTDGSFVRLISPVANGDEKETLASMKNFAEQLFPILNEYIPS